MALKYLILWISGMLAALGAGSASANELDDFACDYVLGDWTGVYRWDGAAYPEDDYRFDSAYDEDGSVIIDFVFLESGIEDRHEGFWTCEDGVLTTGLLNENGANLLFQYQILEIDRQTWVYQLISPFPDAPVFHAERAGPRRMSPEIFDRLRPGDSSN